MKDKERTGHAVLFHEVLSFIDFAKPELFQEKLFDFLILDK